MDAAGILPRSEMTAIHVGVDIMQKIYTLPE